MSTPQVSVCMPAYNVGRFVSTAIASILNQTFTDFELLVVDDGSTDDTWIKASAFSSDPRLRLIRNTPNRGLIYTRNLLLSESRGAYIALADADDIFVSNRIERQLGYMLAHPEAAVVGGNVDYVDPDGKPVGALTALPQDSDAVRFFLMLGPCLANTVTMYRRQAVEAVGGYRAGFDAGAEDYDLWCRLSKFADVVNLPDHLATMHVYPQSVTNSGQGHKHNIYPVAREQLAEYLSVDLSFDDARDLIVFFWHGLDRNADPMRVLTLVQILQEKASERENSVVNRELMRRTNDALWIYAQSIVYSSPAASVLAMKRAVSYRPSLLATRSFAKYLRQLLTPSWLRTGVRRWT